MKKTYADLVELYQDAQIASAQDQGLYFGGTDRYSMDRILEEMASEGYIPELPMRLTYDEMVYLLTVSDRADEIEYLMENF